MVMPGSMAQFLWALVIVVLAESLAAAKVRFSPGKDGVTADFTPWDARALAVRSLRRPPRGMKLGGDNDREKELHVGKFKCGETVKATSSSDKDDICPPECPYYAQNLEDSEHCTFVCVKAQECQARNPNRPIAGEVETQYGDVRMICRSPVVQHCVEYDLTGEDRCKVCQQFYTLGEDGQCYYKFIIVLWLLLVVLVVAVVFLVVWVTDLVLRGRQIAADPGNTQGLVYGLEARELALLHMPKQEGGADGTRDIWPLSTNLCSTNVAGAGMILHFNFQALVIFWALAVALMWCSFIWFVDPALAILGTRRFGTPRQNCILVAWGFETQQRLMWTKIWFLAAVYLFTFVGCLLHGVRQLRIFQKADARDKTMQDFVAFCTGLPIYKGTVKAEENLKKSIADATGQGVVGVSICWDYTEDSESIDTAIQSFIDDYREPQTPVNKIEFNAVREYVVQGENYLFVADPPEAIEEAELVKKLETIQSSDQVIVVFETEAMRDAAVELAQKQGGLKVDGNIIKFSKAVVEPENINWQNFGHSGGTKAMRLIMGFGRIGLALLCWAVFFYAPYAWSIFTWNYDNGIQPPFIYGFAFSMVVCIGNAIMYITCDSVSENVGFQSKDSKETCYMVLYTVSCTLNILLDLVTTYYTALYVMTGLNFRTYHGTKIEHLSSFHGVFESYAIQRSLAESAYQYAFPSTYLIPFLLEPIMTIWLPLQFYKMIVRAHPQIQGREAEANLSPAPMELGRYADILLNMVLGILIFYFPGGYTHTLFFSMAGCHVFIYAYDHWKVLRGIPQCTFANMEVDWWAQLMLAPCCALILACFVFKANCQDYGYCMDGGPLALSCFTAAFVHMASHILILIYVIPKLGISGCKDDKPSLTFQQVNKRKPCSWFNANPLNCLRSKYIYKHDPPCVPFSPGKEHFLKVNDQIGCFFHDVKAKSSFSLG